MKKIALCLITVMILITVISCGKTEEKYSMQAFEEGMKINQQDPAKLYALCLDFYKNSKDMDILRNATSNMAQLDNEKTMSILKENADKNPDDKVALYLYARMLEDKAEVAKLSRKIIELNPEWEYGYRLLTVNYMQHLFSREGGSAELLRSMLPDDEKHFEKFKNFTTTDGIQSIVYFRYLIYKNDPEAVNFAVKAAENKEAWANDDILAEVFTISGQYDKAQEHFYSGIKSRQAEMSEKDLNTYSAISVFYKLQELEKYDEAHDFIMTKAEDLEEKDRYAYSGMLYCKQNETKKAISALQKAAAMGFDDYFTFERNEDMEEIKKTKQWPEIERVTKANYAANSGKRKEATLASKFSRPAPASTFTDAEKKEFTLESLKGDILILDFWATWCGPCKMAMPVLSEFAGKKIEGVRIFSVNVWEQDPEAAKKFFEEQKYNMELAYGEKDSHEKFSFNGIPYICVLDKDGNIRYQENGYSPELGEKLDWWIENLKGE